MLYITTRNDKEFHTSYRALSSNRDEHGGLYLPYQITCFTPREIDTFQDKTFSQCVADILNIFFSARLDAWDVACCMGTHPLNLIPMSHKITIAEVWNNPEWSLSRFVRNLNGRILGNADNGCPSNWMEIAARIAVLFGIFGKLLRIGVVSEGNTIDISVISGDFVTPMAAWYARLMGLPIGSIIFSCNENSAAWDLLHRGEAHASTIQSQPAMPASDVGMPINMELLIRVVQGQKELTDYLAAYDACGVYMLSEEARTELSRGMFGAVIGKNRVKSIIRNVYATSAYILNPYSALAYGALQDYRATKAETGQTLILTEHGPLCMPAFVSDAIGITQEELNNRIHFA